jgi:hypothetical protein
MRMRIPLFVSLLLATFCWRMQRLEAADQKMSKTTSEHTVKLVIHTAPNPNG